MNAIEGMLEELAGLKDGAYALLEKKQQLVDQVITPEIKAKIEEINAEFEPAIVAANEKIDALESSIKQHVIAGGETVKGSVLMAVYSKGRVSWDTKALDGYAVAHPEVGQFRKEGAPSVSIRKV